jgi:hypothetical protein
VRGIRAIALGAIVFAASGCINSAQPDANQMSRDVQHLEQAFPVFEELRVRGFRDQDWCEFLDYPNGAFTIDAEASACNLFDGPPKAFDAAARADFARVADALHKTDVRTYLVWWIEYDEAGCVQGAEFDLAAGDVNRWSYIYDRGNRQPKDDIEGESVSTRINDDWWFWWEDWN